MRKLLLAGAVALAALGASSGSAAATTFDGDCTFEGTVFMEEGFTLVPENKDYQAHADGTCTGLVDGQAFDGPSKFYIDGRMDRRMSCPFGFDDKAPGVITFGTNPDAVDAKQLDVSIVESHLGPPIVFYVVGAYNGHMAGGGQFLGAGPEQIEQCASEEGLHEIDFELDAQTITPMYG
jgi:hypothetical protein